MSSLLFFYLCAKSQYSINATSESHIWQEKIHIVVTFVQKAHYKNLLMQYTEILSAVKISLILAQNMDCGYTLELPQRF